MELRSLTLCWADIAGEPSLVADVKALALPLAIGAALLPSALMVLGHWSVGQLWLPATLGSSLPSLGFFMFLPWLAVGVIYVGQASLARWRHPSTKAKNELLVGYGAILGAALLFISGPVTMRLRVRSYAHLAKQAEPIVAALRAFEKANGAAPPSLDALVPGYLPALPSWSRRLEYQRAVDLAPDQLYGNPWMIHVDASWGLGFDSFVFFPNQTYPRFMFGGSPELVGGWAYVHE
jgi:hypothetical protein